MSGACGHCGARLWLNGVRRYGAKFCSASCRVAAYRERTGYRPPPKPPKPKREVPCVDCGVIMLVGQGGRLRCDPCREVKKKAGLQDLHKARMSDGRQAAVNDQRRKHEPRPCQDCGLMLRIGVRCRACSSSYRNLRRGIARRRACAEAKLVKAAVGVGPRWILVAGFCRACNASFVTWGESEYCSRPCRGDGKSAASARRRRDREVGYKLTPRRRLAVHERCGWICQICGNPVNRDAVTPAPDAPVIDHLVPLAAGGAHHEGNWQTAHFYCNTAKGARMAS